MLIYLDSVILIYFLDHVGPSQVRAANRLTTLRSVGDHVAVSDLSRLECRVKPIPLSDSISLGEFDAFFALPDVRVIPLSRQVVDRATEIRARHRFKTMDSIHLAAAVEAGCGVFLTNDVRLSSFVDITVEILV